MPIRSYKPTSAGRRFQTVQVFDEITATKPHKPLTEPLHPSGGRNNRGEITIWWRGGRHKRLYRTIDFKRDKRDIPGKVLTIEYDPNRSARIALVGYSDGEKRYILHPVGLKVGAVVVAGENVDILPGNALPLANIPLGTQVHNVELQAGQGRADCAQRRLVGAGRGERRRLRLRQDAFERDSSHPGALRGDGGPGRQRRSRERVDRQGWPKPLARQASARQRRGHEPCGPSARRRRGQDVGRSASGDAVGPADERLQDPEPEGDQPVHRPAEDEVGHGVGPSGCGLRQLPQAEPGPTEWPGAGNAL